MIARSYGLIANRIRYESSGSLSPDHFLFVGVYLNFSRVGYQFDLSSVLYFFFILIFLIECSSLFQHTFALRFQSNESNNDAFAFLPPSISFWVIIVNALAPGTLASFFKFLVQVASELFRKNRVHFFIHFEYANDMVDQLCVCLFCVA